VRIEFDAAKNAANIRVRGLSFERVVDFDWDSALVIEDRRRDYGEPRFRAIGYLDARLHIVVLAPRDAAIRIVSLRRANRREVRGYEKAIAADTNRP
jgi:uncharacterized DUF497 family protein